jgi:hypothetical protein
MKIIAILATIFTLPIIAIIVILKKILQCFQFFLNI